MNRLWVLTSIAALARLAFAAEGTRIVATGWDVVGVPPEDIVANVDKIEKTAYDGVSFWLENIETVQGGKKASCENAATGGRWLRSSLERYLPVFREAQKHRCLQYSFIQFLYQPMKRLDWKDDAAWADFAANMRTLAWLAKAGGLKGLFMDTEEYWRQFQYVHNRNDPPFAETAKLARQRGAEVFKGVFEEFPDIIINTTWWLSTLHEYASSRDIAAEGRGLDDLLPAFTDGILDVIPLTARFLDGNEHTYSGLLTDNFVAQRLDHQRLVSSENRAKFRACFGASNGFYLDMYVNPKEKAAFYRGPVAGRRLNGFIDRLDDALNHAEEFVWIFGEHGTIIDWKDPHSRYSDPKTAYGDGTWVSRLPGLDEEMRLVRNPRKELLTRFRDLKASGKSVNLAGEPTVEDGGFTYSVDVGPVRYGEWYAVTVEVKSDYPHGWIYPICNKDYLWDQRLEHVVFEPQSESMDGRRRGVGFIRIRGAADAIRVRTSYNRYVKTKPEDVRIRVYRVFEPTAVEEPVK